MTVPGDGEVVGLAFLLEGCARSRIRFTIEPAGPGAVRFVDTEEFNGLLVPLQAGDIDTHSRRGFEEMDKALKARAEQS